MKPPLESPWLAAVVVGLGSGAALWGPGGIAGLALATLALDRAITGYAPGDAARGMVAGVLWQALALGWIAESWRAFGAEGAWLVGPLVLVQAIPLAVGLGVAGALARHGRTGALAAGGLAFGALTAWTPIPLLPTYALVEVPPLAWGAVLVGRTGLTAMLWAWRGSPWILPYVAVGVGWAVGAPRLGEPVRLGVVEAGIGALDGRRASTAPDREARLLAAIRALPPVDVALTPEGAWPGDPGEPGGERRRQLEAAWAGLPPTVLGADHEPRNRLLAIDGGVVGTFDKQRLLPIAEDAWAGLGRDRYVAGDGPRRLAIAGIELGPLVCYEDLFASDVRAAAGAELLLAPTNDAWGGSGAWAHLAAARIAAVEAGRWLARPTTSGISAVVDPAGRLAWSTPFVDRDDHPDVGAVTGVVDARRLRWRAPGPWSNLALPAIGVAWALSRMLRSGPRPPGDGPAGRPGRRA